MRNDKPTSKGKHLNARNIRPTIGFLTHGLLDNYSMLLWHGVMDATQEEDANLICFLGRSLESPRGFEAQANILYDLVSAETVDGLVLSSSALSHFVGQEGLRTFCERYAPLPMVSIAVPLEGIHSIVVDNYHGIREVMIHLIDVHGCRRIAFIRGPDWNQEAEIRYRAYLDVLTEFTLPLDQNLVACGDFEESSGTAAIPVLMDERKMEFEAVVAANDEMAIGALKALQARGICVPDEMIVTGFDDIENVSFTIPPFTTVCQPIYDQARQATKHVLAQVRGEDVPEHIILPTQLVVRQSCGCVDPTVMQIAVGPVTGTGEPFKTVFATQREKIRMKLSQAGGGRSGTIPPGWADQLLEAFAAEMNNPSDETFLHAWNRVLRQVIAAGGNVADWHGVLSTLRRHVLPYLRDNEVSQAEDLWQQARLVIGETAKRVEMWQAWLREQQTRMLQEIEAALITTFDVASLMDVAVEELPRLGIPGCYLSLYENPKDPVSMSKLILAYNETGRVGLEPNGHLFPSRQILPEGMLFQQQRSSFVVESLYFQEKQLGFVLFEVGPQEQTVYEALRGQISSALQGALLVQRVQEHSFELAAAYEEIRTLNDQLKEENVRMSMELNVARRLQEMILPSSEELQQIQGLDIVGYMQPADEVGGDYYDILKENGTLHIGIGDVTGHGLESGVLMLMTQTAIRTLIEHGETDPVVFVNTLNRTIYKNVQRMGADKTLTFALVKYQDGQLKIVGQHEEMLVVRQNGQVERMDTIDLGFPIGLEKEIAQWVASATVSLQPGDGVVLYTDGITEAENMERKLYGLERLCAIVSRHWDRSAEEIKQAVVDDVTRHIGKQKVYDDLTLIVLKQK